MSGLIQHYLIRSGALALATGVVLTLIFFPQGPAALLFAVLGWAPMALIGVAGGGLAVSCFGRAGAGFPFAVLACILLRLLLGFGGLALAHVQAQVVPYLAGSVATFAVMQLFETLWFLHRNRLQQASRTSADAIG